MSQSGNRPAQLADFRLPPFNVGTKLDVGAQGFKQLINDRRILAAGLLCQLPDRCGQLVAEQQDTQAMRVPELERRISLGQFSPKLPHPETASAFHRVVEQDHARGRHLRKPAFEIVLDGLVSVQAVNVQQVDAAVLELVQGFVKRRPQEVREAREMAVMDGTEFAEYLFPIRLRVLVALPGIHRVTDRLQAALLDCLTEREVGRPAMGTKLDENLRPQRIHQPTGERNMAGPGTWR